MIDLNSGRVIKLFGDINEKLGHRVMSSLIDFSKNATDDITLLINSGGGDLYSTFAIHDVITNIPNKVITVAIGKAFSGAALLLSCGNTRFITSNTSVMLHEPSLTIPDDSKLSYISYELDHSLELQDMMYKLLAKYTGQPIKKVIADLNGKDYYLTSQEAKQYGLVDNIIKSSLVKFKA